MLKQFVSIFFMAGLFACNVGEIPSVAEQEAVKQTQLEWTAGVSCNCDPCIDSLPGTILQDTTLCTMSVCTSSFGGSTVIAKPVGTQCHFTSGPNAGKIGHCETDPDVFCSTCEDGRQLNEVWTQPHNDCRQNICYNDQGLLVQDYIDVQAGTPCTKYEVNQPGTCDGLGSCI